MLETITTQDVTVLAGALSVLAFFVSVIIEIIKDLPGIQKIPTKLLVLCVSMVLCVVGTVAYCNIKNIPILWYYVCGSAFGSFLVAYVSMYGFDTLKELWDRFYKGTEE